MAEAHWGGVLSARKATQASQDFIAQSCTSVDQGVMTLYTPSESIQEYPMKTLREFTHRQHLIRIVSVLKTSLRADGTTEYEETYVFVDGQRRQEVECSGSLDDQERDIKQVINVFEERSLRF